MPGKGAFYLTGAITDTKIVTIGARVYEFSTDGVGAGANVVVNCAADQNAAAAITALVAAINADASREADAVAWTTNNNTTAGCNLVEKTITGVAPVLSTNEVNGVVSAATLIGAAASADKTVFHGAYAITAADVTALARTNGAGTVVGEVVIGSIGSTSSPAFRITDAYNSAGVKLADNTLVYKWVQHNANLWSLVLMDPVAVLANTNAVNWMAIS